MRLSKKYFFLTALAFWAINGHSQIPNSTFLSGFVITTQGDTLRGKTLPGLMQVKILTKSSKKAENIKHKDIIAYRYGRYTYHNINGYYRLVINGPVCLYVKDVDIPKSITPYSINYLTQMTYYVVKRIDEKEVTVLQTLRSSDYDASLVGIAAVIATNITTDLVVNDQTTMLQSMKKIAAEYFKDYPELVADLADDKKYNSPNSIHSMAERYNEYILPSKKKN